MDCLIDFACIQFRVIGNFRQKTEFAGHWVQAHAYGSIPQQLDWTEIHAYDPVSELSDRRYVLHDRGCGIGTELSCYEQHV